MSAISAQTVEELFAVLKAGTLYNLDGLVAVVTGGASGIGLMIAITLLANGAVVHIVDRAKDSLDNVKHIYDAICAGRLFVHEGDTSIKGEAARLADAVTISSPYVNILFNNAGILGDAVQWDSESMDVVEYVNAANAINEDSFNRVFGVNIIGPYFFSVAFLPLLCASKQHHTGKRFAPQIVNTCSAVSWAKISSSTGYLAYTLSKGALRQLTLILAHEFSSLKVRANGIAPGAFLTGMTSSERTPLGLTPSPQTNDHDEPVYMPEFKVSRQLGRFEDISGVVLMLATNRFINGEITLIDGGLLLHHPSH